MDLCGIYARSARTSPEALQRQVETCRAFLLASGSREAGVYAEDGHGGHETTSRPGLVELLERALEGDFDTIVVERTDRLSRDALVVDGLVETLAACGVTVVSVTDGVVERLGHDVFARGLIKRSFSDVSGGLSAAETARGFNRDRIPHEKLIRWEDVRAVRQRYERRGYTNVVVTIEAADKDGVLRRWSSPETAEEVAP